MNRLLNFPPISFKLLHKSFRKYAKTQLMENMSDLSPFISLYRKSFNTYRVLIRLIE